ncbi:MAG: VOC family protein [Acidiferrobacteraceae bacterium]
MADAFAPRFHLAFPVDNLMKARAFYAGVLGCPEGRSGDTWQDFDLYGHQIVAHLAPARHPVEAWNRVDGDDIPIPHFGAILNLQDWHALAERLRAARVRFIREPGVRFAGEPGEQWTLFVLDPSGNALEFKAFPSPDGIFSR